MEEQMIQPMEELRISDSDSDDGLFNLEEYDMNGDPCGKCLIFLQTYSDGVYVMNDDKAYLSSLKEIVEKDGSRLATMFKWLKFEVFIYKDKKKDDMIKILERETSDESFGKLKCLFVCISSHGEKGGVFTSDGDFLETSTIMDTICKKRNTLLVGKPKLLLIDACRGEKDGAVHYYFDDPVQDEEKPKLKVISADADQVILHATARDTVSYGTDEDGSRFTKLLCDVFEKKAHKKSFYELNLVINNIMATRQEDGDDGIQMSSLDQVTLRKTLNFKPDCSFKKYKKLLPNLSSP